MCIAQIFAYHRSILGFSQRVVVGVSWTRFGEFDSQFLQHPGDFTTKIRTITSVGYGGRPPFGCSGRGAIFSTACAKAAKSTTASIFCKGSPMASTLWTYPSSANRAFVTAVLRAIIPSTPFPPGLPLFYQDPSSYGVFRGPLKTLAASIREQR